MEILNVKPTSYMQRIASLLKDAAYELLMAVAYFFNIELLTNSKLDYNFNCKIINPN